MKIASPPLPKLPWRALAALFFALGVPLAIFGKIADDVRDGEIHGFDDAILNGLHLYATPARDAFFVGVAHWGGAFGLVPLALSLLVFLIIKKRRGDAGFWFLSVAGALLLNFGAKLFFGRARPELWLSPAPQSDFSFPSGHAMLSTAFFAALVVLAWETRFRVIVLVASVAAVALICLSRLYLGVHYPTDVLGGVCASLAWVNGVRAMRNGARKWRKDELNH